MHFATEALNSQMSPQINFLIIGKFCPQYNTILASILVAGLFEKEQVVSSGDPDGKCWTLHVSAGMKDAL